jgi:hypothetical protein
MPDPLVFPRLVYRGEPDTLGTQQDAKGRLLNSETKKVDSQIELDAAIEDGWRLTRADGKPVTDPDRGAIKIPAQTVITDPHDNPDAHARADAKAAAVKAADDADATAAGTKGLPPPAHNAVGPKK